MNTTTEFQVGDRVEGGIGDDADRGVIHEIDADRALVGWESGVTTWTPVSDLRHAD